MKIIALVIISTLVSWSANVAIARDTQETMATLANVPLVEGLVKKIDRPAGKITLTHGPLPNGMPGMTMAFRVKESSWLDTLHEGQKIRFAADQIDGIMTVVRFEPGK